jgi:hypothetical protein
LPARAHGEVPDGKRQERRDRRQPPAESCHVRRMLDARVGVKSRCRVDPRAVSRPLGLRQPPSADCTCGEKPARRRGKSPIVRRLSPGVPQNVAEIDASSWHTACNLRDRRVEPSHETIGGRPRHKHAGRGGRFGARSSVASRLRGEAARLRSHRHSVELLLRRSRHPR